MGIPRLAVAFAAYVLGSTVLVAQPALPTTFTVVEVRVHGNHTTPEADILALAAIPIGTSIADTDIMRAGERLRTSSHFADVEVRVRSRSIDDPAQVAVVIIVRERSGVTPDLQIDKAPSPLRRLRGSAMFLPILDYEDGYGLTYGARVSFMRPLGARSRVSLPASWGGTRRVAVEVDKAFGTGSRVSSVLASAALAQREHPYYGMDERRVDVLATVRTRARAASVAAVGGWSDVSFGVLDERYTTLGIEADLDTRNDPTFPRNAIYLRGRVRWLTFDADAASVDADRRVRRSDVVAQGFVRFIGSSVIGVSARYETADAPLPPYLKSMLGGTGSVRGFETGYEVGDTLWASSIELRVPLSSATRLGRIGLRAFVDAGDIADDDGVFTPPTRVGVGGGVFTQASLLQLGADVAYGLDRGWRLHVSSGVRF